MLLFRFPFLIPVDVSGRAPFLIINGLCITATEEEISLTSFSCIFTGLFLAEVCYILFLSFSM
jgi:hypothetical protein